MPPRSKLFSRSTAMPFQSRTGRLWADPRAAMQLNTDSSFLLRCTPRQSPVDGRKIPPAANHSYRMSREHRSSGASRRSAQRGPVPESRRRGVADGGPFQRAGGMHQNDNLVNAPPEEQTRLDL